MIIDLTLDSLKFPGLENFTPPFGTKKGDNVGLTTLEGCNNLAKPWQDQRPIVISEHSTFNSVVERNAIIEIDTAAITLTLTDGAFKGVTLELMCSAPSGTANILYGAQTFVIEAGERLQLIWNGNTWQDISNTKRIYYFARFPANISNVRAGNNIIGDALTLPPGLWLVNAQLLCDSWAWFGLGTSRDETRNLCEVSTITATQTGDNNQKANVCDFLKISTITNLYCKVYKFGNTAPIECAITIKAVRV